MSPVSIFSKNLAAVNAQRILFYFKNHNNFVVKFNEIARTKKYLAKSFDCVIFLENALLTYV